MNLINVIIQRIGKNQILMKWISRKLALFITGQVGIMNIQVETELTQLFATAAGALLTAVGIISYALVDREQAKNNGKEPDNGES